MLKTSGTVGEALDTIAMATGITSREGQLDLLNKMRQWIYSQKEELGLDLTMPLCVPVTKYYVPCNDKCSCEIRKGFRLPFHYQSIQIIEYSGEHVELYSQARLPYDGISIGRPADGTEGIKAYRRDNYPLEFDLQKDSALKVVWESNDPDDQEFSFALKGYSPTGQRIDTVVSLEENGSYDVQELFREISHLQFLKKLQGTLTIQDENGFTLGKFYCGEKPGFVQYEVRAPFCITRMRIHANLAYKPVTDEDDLVEFGDTLVWELLAKYLNALLQPRRDPEEEKSMARWFSTFVGMIKGEQDIEHGNIDMHFQRQEVTGIYGLESTMRNCSSERC